MNARIYGMPPISTKITFYIIYSIHDSMYNCAEEFPYELTRSYQANVKIKNKSCSSKSAGAQVLQRSHHFQKFRTRCILQKEKSDRAKK